VLDQLISHELELTISASEIADRLSEWNGVLTAPTRADYVKGIAKFCGLELIDYANAAVHRDMKGNFTAKIRSQSWVARQTA